MEPTVADDGDRVLGPFQGFWDAWNHSDETIKSKRLEHFSRAAEIQYEEMAEHLQRANRHAAAREAVDVISIALNTLRWMNFEPAEIAKIAQDRARDRMYGQTHEILEKYDKLTIQHGRSTTRG